MRRVAHTVREALHRADAKNCTIDAMHPRYMGRDAATGRIPPGGILARTEHGFVAIQFVPKL